MRRGGPAGGARRPQKDYMPSMTGRPGGAYTEGKRKEPFPREASMKVKEIMTASPATCEPRTGLKDVAKMMCDNDCGEIPVVEDRRGLKPVGVVTDRDIACRAVGRGRNPLELAAADCMTTPCVTVAAESELDECVKVLEKNHIRRVVVVDETGRCVGIVSQADLALRVDPSLAAELVHEVSRLATA